MTDSGVRTLQRDHILSKSRKVLSRFIRASFAAVVLRRAARYAQLPPEQKRKVFSNRYLDLVIAASVFLAVFLTHVNSGNVFSFDSKWTIHTALSLIREGNTDLDEYAALIAAHDEYGAIETFGGHRYTNFPLGPSLVAVPFVFAIDQLALRVWSFDLNTYVSQAIPADIERFVASIVVALTAVVIYQIARLFLKRPYALLVVFIFAFCTSAWSTASRALWQHGPSMLMLSLALYILLRARAAPRLSQFASLPLALAYVMRPSNSISVALLTLCVLIHYRPYFARYLFWAAVIAAPFVAYNWAIYHAVVSPYYTLYRSSTAGVVFEALLGTLFSPSRGLFVFSPILVLAILSVTQSVGRRSLNRLDAFLVAILVLHWIITSLWPIWWGGWSFGPRLFSDMVPYLMYLMIPLLIEISALKAGRKVVAVSAMLILAGASFFVHYRGANAQDTLADWSTYPANVDEHPDRLWDWRDVQFLRGIKWGKPADVSISGAPIKQLDPETYTLLGTNDLRMRRFEADRSLIAAPGEAWLILADDRPLGAELAHLIDGLAPQARSLTYLDRQAYRVYRVALGDRILAEARQAEQDAGWSLDLSPDPAAVHPIRLPVRFGQTAELIGFQIAGERSAELTVVTYWRAGDQLVDSLLIFLHALGTEAQLVAQEDRLDAPTRHWQPGDLIVQVSRLDVSTAAGPLWIEVGLYNPESGERLPVFDGTREIDRRLLLTRVETH